MGDRKAHAPRTVPTDPLENTETTRDASFRTEGGAEQLTNSSADQFEAGNWLPSATLQEIEILFRARDNRKLLI